mgnify:CR=1 FL=1
MVGNVTSLPSFIATPTTRATETGKSSATETQTETRRDDAVRAEVAHSEYRSDVAASREDVAAARSAIDTFIAVAKQARSAVEYRQQREDMRRIIHDDDRSAEDRIAALKELLPKEEKSPPNTHAAMVRQSLTDDAARVTALLNAFSDLDLKGQADQRLMKQVVALRELIGEPLDLLLVIGGYNSANTGHLLALAHGQGLAAYHVEGAQCLESAALLRHWDGAAGRLVVQMHWWPDKRPLRVGIAAGASTPDARIGELVLRVAELAGCSEDALHALAVPHEAAVLH